jgi:hypothetical protein
VTLQAVYCCGPGRTSGPFVFEGRASGLSREIKKTWAVLVGGYIFSHKIRLRPRLLKQFIPKKVIEKNFLYYHKVICQDVF